MKKLLSKIGMITLYMMVFLFSAGRAEINREAVTSLCYDHILFYWEFLTLEERAEYSKEWVPRVEAELKVNPEYRGFHYYETRHIYGVPDESDITQEAAREIATAQIEEVFGIRNVSWEDVYADVYFDITNPEAPLWKMYFAIDEIDPWRFIWVEIDAKQGEVMKIIERDNRMEYYEFM